MSTAFRPPRPDEVEPGEALSDPENVARILVLRRLDHAPRTRVELERYLTQRGIPDEAATTVLDRFTEVGLIDDLAYARGWVTSRHGTRGLGKRAVAQELRRKGVADDIIAEALDPIDADQERTRALQLARSRYPQVMNLPYATQVRRLMGALTRRGYDVGLASAVVREVIADSEDDSTV
ncbi:MAG: regulatory protein RecX [Candidatus Nanopelagicales bacterium]